MTKEKRGIKRLCESCENKFYDLGRDPIVCPTCETQFVPEKTKPKPKPKTAAPAAVAPEPAKDKADKPEVESKAVAEADPLAAESESPEPDSEFVSLEEAAAEEDVDEDAKLADLGDDEVEIPPDDNKDVFLEEDEADSAVSGIIGGVGDTKDEV